jgi:PAS domain S-box-containing protein
MIDSITGIITDCNSRAQELTGYHEELIGLHNSNLFPIENRKDIRFFSKTKKKDDYFVNDTFYKTKRHYSAC